MTDTTVTTAAPPAAAPAPPDLAAQVAALQAQLDALNKPGVVKTAGMFAWTKTKCGARLVADFYAFLNGVKTLLVFGVTGGLALLSEFDAIDLTPYVAKLIPEGSHIDTAGALALLSFTGIGLRLISKTPVFTKWASDKFGGGASDSAVDEPQG
jgi:hypothetical protein